MNDTIPVDATPADTRKEYKLKKPINHGGQDVPAGESVKLRPDQYQRLSQSGHV